MSEANNAGAGTSTLDRYRQMLAEHDWEFDHSDDARVWRLGRLAQEQLEFLRKELDPDYRIWNQHAPAAHRRHIPNTNPLYPDCNS